MQARTIRWGQQHVMDSKVPFPPTIVELWAHSQVGGAVANKYISLGLDEWERLAEHILSERDRREAEAAKQPKRWYVRVDAHGVAECAPAPSNHHGKGVIRGYDSGDMSFYITAKDEREAKAKAQEANHSLGVWIREYLA